MAVNKFPLTNSQENKTIYYKLYLLYAYLCVPVYKENLTLIGINYKFNNKKLL